MSGSGSPQRPVSAADHETALRDAMPIEDVRPIGEVPDALTRESFFGGGQ